MSDRQHDGLSQVEGLLHAIRRAPVAGLRSPLYYWMRQHHDALTEGLQGQRVKWGVAATYLASLGLSDSTGKPPTTETVRQTWAKVRRDVARARAAGVGPVSSPLPAGVEARVAQLPAAPTPAGAMSPSPDSVSVETTPRQKPKMIIQPARPLGSVSVASSPASPSGPVQTVADVEQQVNKLFEHIDARRHPVPRIVE